MAKSKLLPTNQWSIHLTLPSPDIDLLVHPKPLPREAAFTILYQKKIGSVLYVATITHPDIIFIVSWLARFNQDPSQEHYQAVNKVIQYLYSTRGKAIYYGGNIKGMNGKGRDIGIYNKGQDNGRDSKSEA